jgi:hypothetical protein
MCTRLTGAALAFTAVLALSALSAPSSTTAATDDVVPSSILHGTFTPYVLDSNCGQQITSVAIAANHVDPVFVMRVSLAGSCPPALAEVSKGRIKILALNIPALQEPAVAPASDGSYWWLDDAHYANLVPGGKTAIVQPFVAGYAPVALGADRKGDVYSIETPMNRRAPSTPEFVDLQTGKHFRMLAAAEDPGPFLSSADGHAYFELAETAGVALYEATTGGPRKIAWFHYFPVGGISEKAIASDGSIWSAGAYGVVRNDRTGRVLQRVYPIAPRPRSYGIPSREFTHWLAPSRDGTLWFTFKSGLWRLRSNGVLEHADLPFAWESFPRLFAADDGSVWMIGAQVNGHSALVQFRPKD